MRKMKKYNFIISLKVITHIIMLCVNVAVILLFI